MATKSGMRKLNDTHGRRRKTSRKSSSRKGSRKTSSRKGSRKGSRKTSRRGSYKGNGMNNFINDIFGDLSMNQKQTVQPQQQSMGLQNPNNLEMDPLHVQFMVPMSEGNPMGQFGFNADSMMMGGQSNGLQMFKGMEQPMGQMPQMEQPQMQMLQMEQPQMQMPAMPQMDQLPAVPQVGGGHVNIPFGLYM